jgi:hypothetical protein
MNFWLIAIALLQFLLDEIGVRKLSINAIALFQSESNYVIALLKFFINAIAFYNLQDTCDRHTVILHQGDRVS